MQPQPEDTSIRIPITFDYRGGRNENKRNKLFMTIAVALIWVILMIGISTNVDLEFYMKCLLDIGISYIFLVFLRFFVFKELYFSDVYESLKEVDCVLPVSKIWKIFDIDYTYPYVCYYKSGVKGIFVKMEKDAITGKGDSACFDHYEAISEAYNLAHSLNMDIRHIDYMDNVGNDTRMQTLYDNLKDVENPDMEKMLIDIYSNLQSEMSLNYASFDIYLFLSRDRLESFTYNVTKVCNTMLGGNFITYRVMNRSDIRAVCMALFNLHDFSVTDSCEEILKGESHTGIVPIRVMDESDGSIDKLNKTQAEKKQEAEANARHAQEAKIEARNKRRRKNTVAEQDVDDTDDLNLF